MTQSQFIERLAAHYANAVEISKRKNADYATEADPFANFKACEMIGIPATTGILVRMTDKLMRVSNLLKKGEAQVKDESIGDTLSDLANYAIILRMLIENK